MSMSFSIGPIVALIAGVLILIIPRLLNYIIALYLIIVGILGITGYQGGSIRSDATDRAPAAIHSIAPNELDKTTGI